MDYKLIWYNYFLSENLPPPSILHKTVDLRLYLFTRLLAWLPIEIRSPETPPFYVINPTIHNYPKFHPFLGDPKSTLVLCPNPHGLHRSTHPSIGSWDRGQGSPRYIPVFSRFSLQETACTKYQFAITLYQKFQILIMAVLPFWQLPQYEGIPTLFLKYYFTFAVVYHPWEPCQ